MATISAAPPGDILMRDVHSVTQPIPLCIQEILDTEQSDKWLSAVRSLKNRIIGSNRRKQQALDSGIVPRLLSFVHADGGLSGMDYCVMLQREAVLVLCSLAKGTTAHTQILINAQLLQALTHALGSNDLMVVEACVKCVLSVFLVESTSHTELFKNAALLERLIAVQCLSRVCQKAVTQILAHVCKTSSEQKELTEAGAMTVALAQILGGDNTDDCVHALRLLAALTHHNQSNCAELVKDEVTLRSFMDRSRPTETQFAAAQCFTNMYRCGLYAEDDPLICSQVMPCVVRQCRVTEPSECRVQALHCISYLCEPSVYLQRLTADNQQCLRMLAQCLHSASNAHDDSRHYANLVSLVAAAAASSTGQSVTPMIPAVNAAGVTAQNQAQAHSPVLHVQRESDYPERLEIAALSALASLSLNDEDIRRKVGAEMCLFECILRSATEPSANKAYVLAVCRCLHALSRSVEQLRITFQDRAIWKTLLQVCESGLSVQVEEQACNTHSIELCRVAVATLCNLLLPFSPCQTSLFENGALELLVSLTKHKDESTRVNAIWALMNASYRATETIKLRIMNEFGCVRFVQLLTETSADADNAVVLPLLALLRNILAEVPAPIMINEMQPTDRLNEHLDELMDKHGAVILQALTLVLDNNYTVEAKQLSLQTLENLASLDGARECIINNDDLLKKINTYMMQPVLCLQIASVSVVCNLLCRDDPDADYRHERLEELDVRRVLHQLQNTTDAELYEKVKLALQHFSMG